MKSVQSTVYSKNFPPEVAGEVFFLGDSEASLVFEEAFGQQATSFFDLPDVHWFVRAKSEVVGRWLESYNTGDVDSVETILKKVVNWALEDEVYYIAKKFVVFKTTWNGFVSHWDAFLACEDDAPILMRTPSGKEAVMFTSLGEIRHIIG